MSERTDAIRFLINSHKPVVDQLTLIKLLVEEAEAQEAHTAELQQRIDNLSATISNQYERHSNQIGNVRKEIEKLKGVHGA
jgi:predicted  nucleic acid-binding Zn-ribbon protein